MEISYVLTDQTIKKLNNLNRLFAEKYFEVKSLQIDEREAIHHFARISSIGASTRIENALLTDTEIDWVDTLLEEDGKITDFQKYKPMIENKLSKDRERSIEEVAGCRAMLFLIYEQAQNWIPLTETVIRGLHYELMRYYQKSGPYIGCYKIQSNSVIERNHATNEQRIVFQTADAGPITETSMSTLVEWYNKTALIAPWNITVICEFVYRFLAIHPFQDGNGRLGRGLFLLALLQSQDEMYAYLAPYLAIDRHIEQHKSEYYWVLNRCSDGKFEQDPKKYKIEYFLIFMIKILEEALNDISYYKDRYRAYNNLSKAAVSVLNCFKEQPEIRLNTDLICKETNLPRRTVTHSLSTLLKQGFLQKYGQGRSVRYQLIF